MTVTNTSALDAYAQMSQQAYEPTETTLDVVTSNGTYTEIAQDIDATFGFQARAFLNTTNNELVIAFSGTEGVTDFDAIEALPDLAADLVLAVTGFSVQNAAAELFVSQAIALAKLELGLLADIDVTYTGHSLGGFIAQTVTANDDLPIGEVVAFNAPGAGGFLNLRQDHPFPEDNFTYIYSDPEEWGVVGSPIHSIGEPLSDNLYYVSGSEGHGIGPENATDLGVVLDETTELQELDDSDFLPVDEAFQLLSTVVGGGALLDLYDGDDSGSGPTNLTLTGTAGNDTLSGRGRGRSTAGRRGVGCDHWRRRG